MKIARFFACILACNGMILLPILQCGCGEALFQVRDRSAVAGRGHEIIEARKHCFRASACLEVLFDPEWFFVKHLG